MTERRFTAGDAEHAEDAVRFTERRVAALLEPLLCDDSIWQVVPDTLQHRVHDELAGAGANGDELSRVHRQDSTRGIRPTWRSLVAAAAVAVAFAGGAATMGLLVGGNNAGGQAVRLAATELAPGASAALNVTDTESGLRIAGDFAGLPPAAPGTYYQAWLKNDADIVAIGTFHLRQGGQDVVLWSGVDAAEYPKLTVTLQREGEGPASSGRVLLVGDVPHG